MLWGGQTDECEDEWAVVVGSAVVGSGAVEWVAVGCHGSGGSVAAIVAGMGSCPVGVLAAAVVGATAAADDEVVVVVVEAAAGGAAA